jgi:hypothetical protein
MNTTANHTIKTFKSYTELAAANGDFIPMWGETKPEPATTEIETATTENKTTEAGLAEPGVCPA